MWSEPTKDELERIPKLYEQDGEHTEDKLVYLHFFVGSCDWFITEFDGQDIFFGFAILGDTEMAEWGYMSFTELKEFKGQYGFEVDADKYWEIKKVKDIPKIIEAGGCW